MSIPVIQVPSLELDRVAAGDFYSIRDALAVLSDTLNQLGLQSARRDGRWREVAYAAGNFTTNGGGSWTVDLADQVRYRYVVIDNLMVLDVYLADTVVNNAGTTELRIAIPAGYKAAGTVGSRGAMLWSETTTPLARVGAVIAAGGLGYVSCQRWDTTIASAFTNGATTSLGFTLVLEITPTQFGLA